MKNLHVVMMVSVILVVGLFAVVTAQADNALAGLVQPLIVDIDQAVPASVMVAVPLDDGELVTVTTPITVHVALRVFIDGPQVVTVEPLPADEAQVTISALASRGEPLVDENGIEYQMEVPNGIEIVQMRAGADSSGDFMAIGELRNDGHDSLSYVFFYVTFYDVEGNIANVEEGSMSLDDVPPGGTSPFEILTYTPFDLVGSYLIQVEARFDD